MKIRKIMAGIIAAALITAISATGVMASGGNRTARQYQNNTCSSICTNANGTGTCSSACKSTNGTGTCSSAEQNRKTTRTRTYTGTKACENPGSGTCTQNHCGK